MIVSFDLDDTLFVSEDKFQIEKPLRFPLNHIFREHLRLGTVALMRYIRAQRIQLWIYTTSYRSEGYIRRLFRCYGVKIDRVINGKNHADEVQGERKEAMPSKYPAKYHIDLHVDDDASVAQNGKIYGFEVALVGEQDDAWAEKIKAQIQRVQKKNGIS